MFSPHFEYAEDENKQLKMKINSQKCKQAAEKCKQTAPENKIGNF
jgi:hypothetical protein